MTQRPAITCMQITAIVTLICGTLLLTTPSCKKKSGGAENAKFIGTWSGTSSCTVPFAGSVTDTVIMTLSAGAASNTLILPATVASDTSCITPIVINFTASGNTLTMPSQTFTDGCGTSWTYSGNGTINGNTLNMTFTTSFMVMGFPVTSTCTSVLTK